MPASIHSAASPTRRRILGWSGAGALGGIACYLGWPENGATLPVSEKNSPTTSPASQSPEAPVTPDAPSLSGMMRRDDFVPHVTSEFRLESAGTSCKLVEVGEEQKTAAPAAEFVSFSLLFSAPRECVVESQVHQLTHGTLGTLQLFLSPVGNSKEHVYLEAVCSRRV
ncbi:MAG: hypothetical protein V4584_18515 [Verrucomicrobiota bacterium]